MGGPLFRLVCTAGVLRTAPGGWVSTMLQEGELALLVDDGGLEAITALAHALDRVTVPLLRTEETPAQQDGTVMSYAGSKPLVWIARQQWDRNWKKRYAELLSEQPELIVQGEKYAV